MDSNKMGQLTPDETLLGLLAARPQHGYELMARFRDPQGLGEVWRLSSSQLYAVLKRLEGAGLTTGRAVPPPDAPTRTEYALTEAGRARLMAWLADPAPSASVNRVRVEFLSRLYIADLLGQPAGPIIAAQRAVCKARLDAITGQLAALPPGIGRLTLELVAAQVSAILTWLHDMAEAEQN
jgi:DNA-binding PadR family transcriptional regulator